MKVHERQALSDFQRACGKMHAQMLLSVRWCAMSIFLFLKFSPLNLEKDTQQKNAVVYENYGGKNMLSCIWLTMAKFD